jgi:UDP-glucose 4-epimerase
MDGRRFSTAHDARTAQGDRRIYREAAHHLKHALITGGSGVIGSNLSDALLERGYEVTVIDNLLTGRIQNIEHNLENPKFHLIHDTILNEPLMDELIKSASVVYHLAAAVGVKHIVNDPLQGILINVKGSEIVFAHAFKYWKRVVFASTSEIYGRSTDIPFKEDGLRVLGPTHVDRWSYSTSKALDEHLAFAYHHKGLPVSIVRYFNAYGPRIDESGYGSVVANFISQAFRGEPLTVHGDGQQTRCFTFVGDTVRGTIATGEHKAAIGQAFNIGNNKEITILELAERIKKLTGTTADIKFIPYEKAYGKSYQDTRRRVPDVSKAQEMLGFRAEVDLDDGLARTIAWAREHYEVN